MLQEVLVTYSESAQRVLERCASALRRYLEGTQEILSVAWKALRRCVNTARAAQEKLWRYPEISKKAPRYAVTMNPEDAQEIPMCCYEVNIGCSINTSTFFRGTQDVFCRPKCEEMLLKR